MEDYLKEVAEASLDEEIIGLLTDDIKLLKNDKL